MPKTPATSQYYSEDSEDFDSEEEDERTGNLAFWLNEPLLAGHPVSSHNRSIGVHILQSLRKQRTDSRGAGGAV